MQSLNWLRFYIQGNKYIVYKLEDEKLVEKYLGLNWSNICDFLKNATMYHSYQRL